MSSYVNNNDDGSVVFSINEAEDSLEEEEEKDLEELSQLDRDFF